MCVDDNDLVADALATKLNLAGGFEWVGHLTNACKLSEEVSDRAPDIILLDIDMPGDDPFDALERLTQSASSARVIMLSGHVRDDLIDRAVEAGAWGYISKHDDAETIINAIKRVMNGEVVIGPYGA